MRFKEISIKNFRNITEINISPDPYLNIIFGDNAQGKSNLLETFYYLCFLKSFRTRIDRNLIRFGEDFFRLDAILEKRDEEINTISVKINNSLKSVEFNRKKIDKIHKHYGNIIGVLFTPEHIEIAKGSPVNRRKYIDFQISQVYPRYLHIITEFKKILYQRNTLLKQIKKGYTGKDQLNIWDEQYMEYCNNISNRREKYLEELKPYINHYHTKLTSNKERLSFKYLRSNTSVERIKDEEIKRGMSLVGPHRDDMELKINDYDVKEYGSQGQQRTLVLSMKMAELEILREKTGKNPVLLLDDVLSELDNKRKDMLINNINNDTQMFLTTTEKAISSSFKRGVEMEIKDGKIIT